jgi:hypothetical protein
MTKSREQWQNVSGQIVQGKTSEREKERISKV